MASTSEILARLQNTPAHLAGPTQEILRKSEAHQMLAQSSGPRTQSSGPSGTKLGSPGHKAGVGSSHKAGSLGSCTWVGTLCSIG